MAKLQIPLLCARSGIISVSQPVVLTALVGYRPVCADATKNDRMNSQVTVKLQICIRSRPLYYRWYVDRFSHFDGF
jgi:hypothetical protein